MQAILLNKHLPRATLIMRLIYTVKINTFETHVNSKQ